VFSGFLIILPNLFWSIFWSKHRILNISPMVLYWIKI